ncbi:Male sterility, NAD-binding protein [Niveomyces insectorum RCEF 264]|uniref:Male sterility, NAD-binding protein n=1 Tax=Niveomyces insectorum RCEF 264 TaxID=1081102 RepID=A0A167UU92_9HYPO|nr:Male sterility, NAD-binding protein [Niveomyces insectorum RCEF 264]
MALTAEIVAERIERFGMCYAIDDLVRLRGRDVEQVPIIGLPRNKDEPGNYEYFTGSRLDRMVDDACRAYVKKGFVVDSKKTVALYATSDLSYVVTFFALFRLGFKTLIMSARLGPPACLSLLERAGADTIVHGTSARIDSTLAAVAEARPDIQLLPILARDEFDLPADAPLPPPFEGSLHGDDAARKAAHGEVALLAHSSGSTGLPKLLMLSHRSMMNSFVSGTGLKAFNALPWYHVHGLITSLQAMWMRRAAHLFNPHLPLTAANLVAALREVQPEICHCVPYALSLIAEDPRGVEVLKQCRIVTSAGANTPDELGDRMIAAGVNLGTIYGLTEVGHVGDSVSRKPEERDSWAYIRPYANLTDHVQFKHLGGNTYESVFLKSHPALLTSNSDDPPGSFHSKDLWSPHPTIPNAWKYIARLDDRITLITGEKILPLAMEGIVREHPFVRDALMFGNDRPLPGLLVFRAQAAAALTEDAFLDAIWPSVEQANRLADEFARITRATVASIAYGVEYPVTDKSNIIRAGAYKLFASQIDAIYARLDGGGGGGGGARSNGTSTANGASNGSSSGSVRKDTGPLDVAGLEQLIIDTFKTETEIELPNAEADFFASGVDSLRAIQARRLFQELLDFGDYKLPTNVVYDARNAANLARLFHGLLQQGGVSNGAGTQNGDAAASNGNGQASSSSSNEDEQAIMNALISKYATFNTEPQAVGGECVVLTGATGALGAHILHQLLHDAKVERVTCLVRGPHGLKRVHASLKERGLDLGSAHRVAARKLAVLETADLGRDAHLGLDAFDYHGLVADTTLIVHAAWPVHFGLSTASFAPHIAGLHNLLQLSLQVPSRAPARVVFASSISAAFNLPRTESSSSSTTTTTNNTEAKGDLPVVTVPEAPLASLDAAASIGYARSKLVGERICEAAAQQGANVAVVRIGQITGDTEHGIWNDREAIPLMVRSALELQALPQLGAEKGRCEWIPVDVVAAAVLDIGAALKQGGSVNGVIRSKTGNGDTNIKGHYYNLNTPHALSWNNDVLPAFKAAGLSFEAVPLADWLAKLRARGDALGPEAAKRLPALKLADYYAASFGEPKEAGIRFAISKACQASPTLSSCPNVADGQLVGKYLQSWLERWTAE